MNKTELFITVIICAHNPRKSYLERVLEALKNQTLSKTKWELILIDNASDQPLVAEFNLNWHPNNRHILEPEVGLTVSRLRGIAEATTALLIFVDDDNILDFDYLETALNISKNWLVLGAWGGQIRPEFEAKPLEWTKPYWDKLAIREFDKDRWSNLIHQYTTTPCGAGLCIRTSVAEEYYKLITEDPLRLNLDRKGVILTSCGDLDMAFTACDIGMGTGLFAALKLTHLIPSSRLEEQYLLKLVEGTKYSEIILSSFRGNYPIETTWRYRILQYAQRLRMSERERQFFDANRRGLERARKELRQQKPPTNKSVTI